MLVGLLLLQIRLDLLAARSHRIASVQNLQWAMANVLNEHLHMR